MALIKEGGVGGISFEVGAPGFLNGLVRMIVGCGGILTNTAEDGLKVQFRIFTAHRVELDRLKEHFLNGRGYNFLCLLTTLLPHMPITFIHPWEETFSSSNHQTHIPTQSNKTNNLIQQYLGYYQCIWLKFFISSLWNLSNQIFLFRELDGTGVPLLPIKHDPIYGRLLLIFINT